MAVKFFRTSVTFEDAQKEIQVMFELRHPHIVGIAGWFRTAEHRHGILIELCVRGELQTCYKQDWFTDLIGIDILAGCALALSYMHSFPTPIVHRDLKSSNILVAEEKAEDGSVQLSGKVADCGESRRVSTDHTMTHVGTPLYAAPEMLRGARYDESVDAYSFGVVISEVMSRVLPFSDVPKSEKIGLNSKLVKRLRKGKQKVRNDEEWDERIRSLIQGCTEFKPRKRPKFPEVADKLRVIAKEMKAEAAKAAGEGEGNGDETGDEDAKTGAEGEEKGDGEGTRDGNGEAEAEGKADEEADNGSEANGPEEAAAKEGEPAEETGEGGVEDVEHGVDSEIPMTETEDEREQDEEDKGGVGKADEGKVAGLDGEQEDDGRDDAPADAPTDAAADGTEREDESKAVAVAEAGAGKESVEAEGASLAENGAVDDGDDGDKVGEENAPQEVGDNKDAGRAPEADAGELHVEADPGTEAATAAAATDDQDDDDKTDGKGDAASKDDVLGEEEEGGSADDEENEKNGKAEDEARGAEATTKA